MEDSFHRKEGSVGLGWEASGELGPVLSEGVWQGVEGVWRGEGV